MTFLFGQERRVAFPQSVDVESHGADPSNEFPFMELSDKFDSIATYVFTGLGRVTSRQSRSVQGSLAFDARIWQYLPLSVEYLLSTMQGRCEDMPIPPRLGGIPPFYVARPMRTFGTNCLCRQNV